MELKDFLCFSWLKKTSILLLTVLLFLLFPKHIHAAQTYDLADTDNWNIRFDGAVAGDWLSCFGLKVGDLNNNGQNDLVIPSCLADNTSASSGSIYIIFDDLLEGYTGTGNLVDMLNSGSYSIRIDGAAGHEGHGNYIDVADVDNDGRSDLIIGAADADYNSRSSSGSSYVLYNNIISNLSGTGNIIDLSDTSSFSLRYDGSLTNADTFRMKASDIDGNSKNDLLIQSFKRSSNRGALYVIYDNLVDDYTGTGNTIDLATTSNFNIRYDGPVAGGYLIGGFEASDVDGDGKGDIFVGSVFQDYNSRSNSGSVWYINGTLVDDYTGTGNTVDLSDSNNWTTRYDGATASDYFGYFDISDINDDSSPDLMFRENSDDNNSRDGSGSIYIVYNSLLVEYTGTGNTTDLDDSSSFNVRLDGVAASDGFGGNMTFADFDGNGSTDIVSRASSTDYNSRDSSGSVYIIFDTVFSSATGTGNTFDLADSSNYNLRYDGPAADTYIGYTMAAGDLNSDGGQDLLISSANTDYNSRDDSGSVWIIYNFPHNISVNSPVLNSTGTSAEILGSVSASNSVSNVSGVQYSVGSNSPTGTWTACTASDGSFNSNSESFSCSVSGISSPGQIVYVRAFDVNSSYTAQSNYGEVSVLVDSVSDLDPSSYTNDSSPTLSFHKTAYSSGVASYNVHLDNDKNRNFSTSGLPSSGNGTASYTWKDDDNVKIEYLYEDDSDTGNDKVRVYFKKLGSNPLTEGKHSWYVTALNQNNNSNIFSTDFYLDLTNPTISNLTIGGVTGTGTADITNRKVYRLSSSTRFPSFSGTVTDKYQGSERTNDNGSTDTFDEVASGPEKIILTLKKWTKGSQSAPIYEDYLTEEFTLTDIQDDSGNQKTAEFNVTFSQELENGSYQTTIEAKDKAGNTYTQDTFYVLLNSQGPLIGGIPQQDITLETRIIEEKAIEKEETEEGEEGLIVQIKVVDDNSNPVEGAKVTLYSDPQVAFTNNDGIATFNNVVKGEHTAFIEYDGKVGEQEILVGDDTNVKEYHFTIEVKEKKDILYSRYAAIGLLIIVIMIVIFLLWKKKRSGEN